MVNSDTKKYSFYWKSKINIAKEEMIVVKKAEKPAAPKNWAEKMRETKNWQK